MQYRIICKRSPFEGDYECIAILECVCFFKLLLYNPARLEAGEMAEILKHGKQPNCCVALIQQQTGKFSHLTEKRVLSNLF